MKKVIISSLLLAGMAASGAVAFGQTDGVVPTVAIPAPVAQPVPTPAQVRENAREAFQKLQQERMGIQERAVDARAQLRMMAASSTEAIRAMREAAQQKAEQAREAIKAAHEDFKAKIEAARQDIKTKREAEMADLKTKLQAVKDARKKETVTRLDQRFDEINTKLTDSWTNTLARLDELLVKITSRADKAAAGGADVSAVRAGVDSAKAAIAAAKTAVAAQAAKTYPISVTTETALKSAVAQTRELLNKDLQSVRDLMQAAHKAVSAAASSLRAVPGVDQENGGAATSTATTSAQ